MARQQRLRWAIIGVGVAGRARAVAIDKDPRAVLVAVHRGRFAPDVEAPSMPTPQAAIAAADCVAICSPAAAHASQVRAALEADKHVVVEYPLARDATIAADLLELAAQRRRVLHVEHIELLGAVSQTLRALVPTSLIERVDVSFEGPGAQDLDPADVAWSNVARLHRVVDVAGPIGSVESVTGAPGQIRAILRLQSGAPLEIACRYSPVASRRTRMKVVTPGAVWEQINDSLMRNGTPQTLLGTGSLFKLDQLAATARVLDGAESYVPDTRILHVLQVADAIASARPGALAPP